MVAKALNNNNSINWLQNVNFLVSNRLFSNSTRANLSLYNCTQLNEHFKLEFYF